MSTSPQKSESKTKSEGSHNGDNNDVQKVAEIKDYLETRISDLEAEIGKLKDMLVLVDTTLREKSFVPAISLRGDSTFAAKAQSQKAVAAREDEIISGPSETAKISVSIKTNAESLNERQLRRTKDSVVLANAHIDQNKIVIVPEKDVKLSQHTPPFQSFFVNRILRGYQLKDEEDSKSGKLKPNEVLKYNVQETQGTISSVTVSNYRETARLNEILSTITWAFTRMLEKK